MTGTAVEIIGRQALQAVGSYIGATEVVDMLGRQLPQLHAKFSPGFDFLDFEVHGRIPPDLARAALDALEPLVAPAPVAEVVAELMRLRLVTKARAEDPAITDAAISVMAEELSAWPLDVVRTACRSWARNSTWWPSLAELNGECDWRGRRRKRMAEILRRAEGGGITPAVRRMEDAR